MTKRTHRPEEQQLDKFRDLARELECDDDEKSFDERLKRVASPPRPVKAERPQ